MHCDTTGSVMNAWQSCTTCVSIWRRKRHKPPPTSPLSKPDHKSAKKAANSDELSAHLSRKRSGAVFPCWRQPAKLPRAIPAAFAHGRGRMPNRQCPPVARACDPHRLRLYDHDRPTGMQWSRLPRHLAAIDLNQCERYAQTITCSYVLCFLSRHRLPSHPDR